MSTSTASWPGVWRASTRCTACTRGGEFSLFDEDATAYPTASLAAQYVELIRRQQPVGPYYLGGISFGGIVVYEVAQQLRAQGEDVAYLAMLDAVLPGPGLRGRFARFLRLLDLGGRAGAQLLRKSLTRRSRRLLRSHRSAEFGQFQGERLGSMELMREDAYRESAAEYAAAVEPWPLPVTLIVAGKRLDDDPLQPADCGWSQHAARLRTHIVDSEHLELLQRPWVDQVAEILAEGLQCASSVADPSRARSRDSGVADDRLRRRSDILRGTGD